MQNKFSSMYLRYQVHCFKFSESDLLLSCVVQDDHQPVKVKVHVPQQVLKHYVEGAVNMI